MTILYAHLDAVGLCNALLLQQAQALLLRQILRLGRGVLAALLYHTADHVSLSLNRFVCLDTLSARCIFICMCMIPARSWESCMLAQVYVCRSSGVMHRGSSASIDAVEARPAADVLLE